MKRINRRLLAIVASSAVALPMAALVQADEMEVEPHSHPATYEHEHTMEDGSMSPMHAHEHESHPHAKLHSHTANLYGSIRTGFTMTNPEAAGEDTKWDIGNTENTLGSRIGVKASLPMDGGLTAGVHVEKKLGNWDTRLQNAWISGPAGKVTIGQQWTTYWTRTAFDGSYFLGGQADTIFRANGIRFESSLGGPFNVDAMVRDNNSGGEGDGMDIVELGGTLDVGGVVAINVGYHEQDDDAGSNGKELIGITVGGSFGGLGVEAGFSTAEHQDGHMDDDGLPVEEVDRYGFFASYGLSGSGTVYVEYEDQTIDRGPIDTDNNWLLLGYEHILAPGVAAVAEFRTPDEGDDVAAVALVINF